MESDLSSPSPDRLRAWRLYFESALALTDVLGSELEHDAGIPLRWYDVLVQIEDPAEGIPMNQLAERILHSKSGFTRVVVRMEAEGLVRRVRPEHDRRTILVVLTDKGNKNQGTRPRLYHRDGIERHYANTSPTQTSKRALGNLATHAHSAPAASAAELPVKVAWQVGADGLFALSGTMATRAYQRALTHEPRITRDTCPFLLDTHSHMHSPLPARDRRRTTWGDAQRGIPCRVLRSPATTASVPRSTGAARQPIVQLPDGYDDVRLDLPQRDRVPRTDVYGPPASA